jgi:hypothetical protein
MPELYNSRQKRNRLIAIAAGAITVVAIVLAFASGYLGQEWRWLRPAGELLLLAELVGLIVLERHQLFEPVQDDVGVIKRRLDLMDTNIGSLADKLDGLGRLTVCANPPEVMRAIARVHRNALARESQGAQVLRSAVLSGQLIARDTREGLGELEDMFATAMSFCIVPSTAADAKARRWTVRVLFGIGTTEVLEAQLLLFAPLFAQPILNVEVKFFPCSGITPALSPAAITDREEVVVFDDATAAMRWGIMFEDRAGVAFLARWFDDLWAAPNSYLIFSRSGVDQSAIDRIRNELEVSMTSGRSSDAALSSNAPRTTKIV